MRNEIGKSYVHSKEKLKVASHLWGYIAETDEEAIKDYFYPTKSLVEKIAKERSIGVKCHGMIM